MNLELIRDKERLNAYQIDRDRATKLRAELDKDTIEIDLKQTEYDELDEQIVKINKQNKEFYQGATQYTEIINRAKTLETQAQMYEGNISSIKTAIKEMSDSDEDLRAKVANHEEEVKKATADKGRREREQRDATDELAALERRHNQAVAQHGRVEGDLQVRFLGFLGFFSD